MSSWRSFWRDFASRGAVGEPSRVGLPDAWGSLVTTIAAVLGFYKNLTEAAKSVLGLGASFIPSIVLVFACLWCYWVITAKRERTKEDGPSILGAQGDHDEVYCYTRMVRTLCKIALVVFAAFLPVKLVAGVYDILPIPTHFAGYLKSNTGQPVVGASVRVLDSEGADVTLETAWTDSTGFYAVALKTSVDTRAHLLVTLPECTKELRLPLTRAFVVETRLPYPTDLKKVFAHIATCQETK